MLPRRWEPNRGEINGAAPKKRRRRKRAERNGGPDGASASAWSCSRSLFIALFVVFAVAQGLGKPGVPSGDVALVTSVPSELGHISEADYKKSLAQQEAQAGLKKTPKAGSKKAEELKKAAVGELLNTAWIFGEGEELGIKVTDQRSRNRTRQSQKRKLQNRKSLPGIPQGIAPAPKKK